MANCAYIRDDEMSFLQQQQENEAYELWLYEMESKEHLEYLEVLAKGDEHGQHFRDA